MHYEVHGRADPDAPTVLLVSGLGGAAHYWAPNLASLSAGFRVLAYDQRGTGQSPDTLPDGYTVADMADEAADMLDEIGVGRCHVIGHALGGLIGLHLALARPALVDRLVLVNAWARTHAHTIRCFAARTALLQHTGVAAYVAAQPLFLYPAWWMAERQDWLAAQDAAGVEHFPPVDTVFGRIEAIATFDLEARVPEVTAPSLVVATRDDLLVPFQASEDLAARLPNSRLLLLERGGHACNITDPASFDAAVGAFLSALPGSSLGA
jgi:aminoacrylate hydrolase